MKAIDDHWTLGAHPAIEYKRRSGGESWANDYRIEVEATGKFSLVKGPTLATRSRWEFRMKDGEGDRVFHRARQQFKATWKLENWGLVDSCTVANEVFYELDQGQIVANRFFPVSVGWKSSVKLSAGMWLMWLSQRSKSTDEWSGSYFARVNLKF